MSLASAGILLPALWGTIIQSPSPQQLAQKAITNGRRLAVDAPEYSADYRSTWRTYSKGKLESETVITGETYQSSVWNVDIELTRSGKSIKDKDIQKRRKAAGQELQKDYEQRMKRMAEAKEKGNSKQIRNCSGAERNGVTRGRINVASASRSRSAYARYAGLTSGRSPITTHAFCLTLYFRRYRFAPI